MRSLFLLLSPLELSERGLFLLAFPPCAMDLNALLSPAPLAIRAQRAHPLFSQCLRSNPCYFSCRPPRNRRWFPLRRYKASVSIPQLQSEELKARIRASSIPTFQQAIQWLQVMHLDAEKEMMSQCVALLGKFISVREPNIRYLGLENMTRMLLVADVQDIIKRHQAQIITSLKDPDISIRRRALDLLYAMCDITNAKDIVEELLQYLSTADFAMREELALKAAILAEKFAPDLSWSGGLLTCQQKLFVVWLINLNVLLGSVEVSIAYWELYIENLLVNIKLRLQAVLNKFLQPISVSAEEFFPQWKSLSGPPLKLQEVVKGVKPMPIPELANLFTNLQLAVTPGLDTNPNNLVASTTFFSDSTKAMLCLDTNPNNLVASTTFFSDSTKAMLCLIRIETDPSDRTQLRLTSSNF
ncbi:Clathrin/coatomer adaptor adaptin-like N-terminal protein [Dioscorea alata]|uniref:Clathrin/coatomer adaptor adaptin-like N-terminal protein n=1 Tax=Dioscorea alata TaxID=55571 RepID=A0ACB7WNT8_DIOAL|nr:Clathrin/coatomer adaptor adaptin-like N-terminal protein [Dioscorea alata]